MERTTIEDGKKALDDIDRKLVTLLQIDCRLPLSQIAKKLGVSKSTVQYRIKKLEEAGIIEGYYAKINSAKIGIGYHTITFVKGKFGPNFHNKVGNVLAQIPGVTGLYFILGDTDFVVVCLSNNREEFMKKLERIYESKEIERISTSVVMKVMKWDPRVFFNDDQELSK